ncbi:VQ motif-containing protein 8 [Nymphaea thermarum]|nr:VQ motif-containing protein 8 [Nymphaea thermarum]
MSPQRDDQHHSKREVQGTRPSPLKVNKDSHQIHKASSSASSSSSSSSASSSFTQQRHPVIIYTHSPKVIHTQAHDFMALVQKLTGLSSSDAPSSLSPPPPPPPPPQQPSSPPSPTQPQPQPPLGLSCGDLEELAMKSSRSGREDASSSVVTDDHCVDIPASTSSVSPMFEVRNPFFSDIPLYTPTASDYYCSPHHLYRFADPVFSPTNLGGSLSPNIMEVLKAFPEY